MKSRRDSLIVAGGWGVINAVLASVMFIFIDPHGAQERVIYWASVALVITLTMALVATSGRPAASRSMEADGAPAAAFALACLVGALATVFGTYLAYLAVPPVVFCLSRWRSEWTARRTR